MLNGNQRHFVRSPKNAERNWAFDGLSEKIQNIRSWVRGPGEKLLASQHSKPYNFEDAAMIRKSHEQFEFKCMKALESFSVLCEYRKHNVPNDELNELDYLVQNFVDRLNKRTFFVVSCYSYFRLIEELWNILEELQKKSKEVDTYDSLSIKNAIIEIEVGLEKSEAMLNNLLHELERLKVILTPSDPVYLDQLEKSFDDVCKTANERIQEMRIRKLILKKHSKLLECEDNVYESIGWVEELMENIELLYQENCVGKNQLDAVNLIEKSMDIYKQAKTTQAYCNQLLETYSKLCEADGRKVPRGIGLSKNRLIRVWPRLEHRIREFRERTEIAEAVYSQTDTLLKRVQDCLLEASRNPPASRQASVSPGGQSRPHDIYQNQIEILNEEFVETKNLALTLVDRLPRGLLADDAPFGGPIIEDISRLIRLKLYTLWLKLREYEYIVNGYNATDNTTASELGLDSMNPLARSRSTNSTSRYRYSPFEDKLETGPSSPKLNGSFKLNKSISELSRIAAQPAYPSKQVERRGSSLPRSRSVPGTPLKLVEPEDDAGHVKSKTTREGLSVEVEEITHKIPEKVGLSKMPSSPNEFLPSNDANKAIGAAFNQFERTLESLKPRPTEHVDETKRYRLRQDGERALTRFENRIAMIVSSVENPNSALMTDVVTRTRESARRLYDKWLSDSSKWIKHAEMDSNHIRLRDLEVDLIECQTRLNDLIHATCLMTAQYSRLVLTKQAMPPESELLKADIPPIDIDRLNVIGEEVNGMSQTVPLQENFIEKLVLELKSDVRLTVDIDRANEIWLTYKERLSAFEVFITYLMKAYQILPKLSGFQSERDSALKSLRRKSVELSALQVDGRQLIEEISSIVQPEKLHASARKLTHVTESKVQIEWLLQCLNVNLTTLRTFVEEVDMLVNNLQTESSTEQADLTALMPNSFSVSTRDAQQRQQQQQQETLNGYPSSSHSASSLISTPLLPPVPARVKTSGSISMEVNGKPPSPLRFLSPLEDQSVPANDSASLSCRFGGIRTKESLDIAWTFKPTIYKNGRLTLGSVEQLKLDKNDSIEHDLGHATVNFAEVDQDRVGVYTVNIRNLATGEEIKSSATINVHPRLIKPLRDLTVPILDSVTDRLVPVKFEVCYSGFTCTPTINWSFNGERPDSSVWSVSSDLRGTSLFSNTARSIHQGLYECHMQDPQTGFELRSSAHLFVKGHVAPKPHSSLMIGDTEKSGSAAEGEQLIIRCPLPSTLLGEEFAVDWLHNDKVIYTYRPDRHRTSMRQGFVEGNSFQIGQTIWRVYVSEGHCVLSTNAVHQSDHGRYACCIYTDDDVYESTGNVIISEKIRFSEQLIDSVVNAGDPFKLQCRLNRPVDSISAQLQINWFFNEQPISTSEHNHLSLVSHTQNDLVQLSTVKATSEHEGFYRCEIQCGDMIAKTDCQLTVKEDLPPKILRIVREPMGPLSVGESIQLTVYYEGAPVSACKWTKDGQPLDELSIPYEVVVDENTCKLTLPDIQPEVSGHYQVIVKNQQGEDRAGEIVIVKEEEEAIALKSPVEIVQDTTPPIIVQEEKVQLLYDDSKSEEAKPEINYFLLAPSDIQAYPGESVKLVCVVAESDEPISLVWFRGDEVLKPGSDFKMHNDFPRKGIYQLEIRQLSYTDGGRYRAVLIRPEDRNFESPLQIQSFELNILIPESSKRLVARRSPHFLNDGLPTRKETVVGDETIFSCKIGGTPEPSFCWIRDSNLLVEPKNGKIEIFHDATVFSLKLLHTQPEDSGLWELICYNPYGFVLTSCVLSVVHPDQSLTAPPQIKSEVKPSPAISDTSGRLTTPSIDVSPGTAQSMEKESKVSSINGDDIKPPEFITIFSDVNCRNGETIQLKCQISGMPTPAVRWKVNGRLLSNDGRRCLIEEHGQEYTLTIERASVNDSGRYSCTAENVAGIATCSALVFVYSASLSRASSPLSEPGFFMAYREPRVQQEHAIRHSGTQTPTIHRVAVVRSLSGSLEADNLDRGHRASRPKICDNCKCKLSSHKSKRRSYEDHSDDMYPHRPMSSAYTTSRRKHASSHTRRSRRSTLPERFFRHRSEESLVQVCPHCQACMKHRSPSIETEENCIRSTFITEHVFVKDSTERTRRLFSPVSAKHAAPADHRSPTHSTNAQQGSRVVLLRPQSAEKPTVRPIAVRLVPGDSTAPSSFAPQRIFTKSKSYHRSDASSSQKFFDRQEAHYSVVESSDGD